MPRSLRADLLLAQNLKALLHARREDAKSLAIWCGRTDAWISKIINGGRGIPVRELGKVADFFGLTVADLFQHGMSGLSERRRQPERRQHERRSPTDRRQPAQEGRLHPELATRFPRRQHGTAADSD